MIMRKISFFILALFGLVSCNKFLDVVPDDGIATVEMAFNLRDNALRYLATCYSYMTREGNTDNDPGMLAGDEMWDLVGRSVSNQSGRVPGSLFNIARGRMSATNVYGCDWASMYEGIRCCDILCENIANVPDMEEWEKRQWAAEAVFLKAYFHFNLVRKFGPVPLIEASLPIDSDVEQVRVYRNNIDECFDFIIKLLDQAMPALPVTNQSNDEWGRISQSICSAFKAKVCVYAASPLFNGNEEEASLVDNRGTVLFPSKTEEEKLKRWTAAMKACEEALDICVNQGNFQLYKGTELTYILNDSLKTTLVLRNAFNEKWNTEVIWGNTQSSSTLIKAFQQWTMPKFSTEMHNTAGYQFIGVPLKVAEQFYTKHGLPISNDLEWAGVNPLELKVGDEAHRYYLEEGYTTVRMNFDREPRYYAFLGFDGGKWLGSMTNYNNVTPTNLNVVKCRMGGANAKSGPETGPVTGFFPKKLYPYRCIITGQNAMTTYWYPFPMIRLTDLYLLYAEAINEAEGPNGAHKEQLFDCLNAIRSRAHIPTVQDAWDNYSNNPLYYNSKLGMRDIIHRERLIEMSFESSRFWDLRRWKEAPTEYAKFIYGFKLTGSSPEDYYVKTLVSEQSFGLKDYFWPIPTSYIETNPNLKQNIGW